MTAQTVCRACDGDGWLPSKPTGASDCHYCHGKGTVEDRPLPRTTGATMHRDQPFFINQRYRFRALTPPQRNPREYVGTYLGLAGPDGRSLVFDCRPAAGTQAFRADQIISSQHVPIDTPASISILTARNQRR